MCACMCVYVCVHGYVCVHECAYMLCMSVYMCVWTWTPVKITGQPRVLVLRFDLAWQDLFVIQHYAHQASCAKTSLKFSFPHTLTHHSTSGIIDVFYFIDIYVNSGAVNAYLTLVSQARTLPNHVHNPNNKQLKRWFKKYLALPGSGVTHL